ncbi:MULTISPECIES: LppM family (lipo)protein [unclassified Gordonia (in: high G+C Gram-positive bacteria)]
MIGVQPPIPRSLTPLGTPGHLSGGPSARSARTLRASTVISIVALLMATPLLSGCLTRSTTVGDRFAGTVIVATSPDNPRGAPKLDVPESMSGNVSLTDYRQGPDDGDKNANGSGDTSGNTAQSAPAPQPGTTGQGATLVGTRATFSDLTSGQLNQLGDIIANSFGDSAMTMQLNAKRSGDVVRFRGTADLSSLIPGRDYVKLTLAFAGPITATNGQQDSDTSVTWTPAAGKAADFTADATYADPATAAFPGWTWLLVIVCVIVVGAVIYLAYNQRDRTPRPGRPRSDGSGRSRTNPPAAPKSNGDAEGRPPTETATRSGAEGA